MRLKSISEIGSTRLPTNPTLNSRPAMYSWTRTSSNCSVIAATRARNALRSVTTAPRFTPPLAHPAAGHREPAHVAAHGGLADLVAGAHGAEDRADLVHGFHHTADVLRRPVFGAGVVEDDDLHAVTAVRCAGRVARRAADSTLSSRP